ncbi:tyrosine-type recombinase/integrase [Aquibaculum arenosum]|uniref:Tyrosine-type recombinase/integrase n=1 Tax=Aquibaculum arenosum TaxID=3032591 RepID=A0ABT5YMQ6_9PROT|nr:tyrosine-type recombinase/integrase [Fodinicurvata sp. CAU 1616]MDF2096116.1 tyrosine-type recombinase/integrase [Fodinicurvata sp. CAU 1616]
MVGEVHHEQPRDVYLTVRQVGRLLAVAEAHRSAGRRTVSTGVYWGLWWIALTGQRKGAATEIRKANILPDAEAEGWHVAYFTAEEMKGTRDHALPFPPALYHVVEQAMQEAEDGLYPNRKAAQARPPSAFLFPAVTTKSRVTGQPHDRAIAESAINQWITRLRNMEPDPLQGLPKFTLHDIRRSLTTALGDAGLPGICASAILAHSGGSNDSRGWRAGDDAQQGAAITRRVYDASQLLPQKRQGMDYWVNAVLDAYQDEKQRILMARYVEDD